MPRKFFKRYSPDPKRIRDTPGLGFLGERLHQPNLWHFNRHSISKAFAIGLFCMWIPFPFQTLIAAACALLFVLTYHYPLHWCLLLTRLPFRQCFILHISWGIWCYHCRLASSQWSWACTGWRNAWVKSGNPYLLAAFCWRCLAQCWAFLRYRHYGATIFTPSSSIVPVALAMTWTRAILNNN